MVHNDTELEEYDDLNNPPQVMEENEETGITLIGLSQVYNPDLTTFMEPPAISTANQGTIAMVPTNNELSPQAKSKTSMEQFFNAMKTSGNTFMNCTFNFK